MSCLPHSGLSDIKNWTLEIQNELLQRLMADNCARSLEDYVSQWLMRYLPVGAVFRCSLCRHFCGY